MTNPDNPELNMLPGLSFIIADDDTYICNLLRDLLTDLGAHDVRMANDGVAALRQLQVRPADVLLCDVNMSGMDGLELLRHVADVADQPAIIVISAESQRILQTAHQLAQAHDLRVLGALAKPVRRAQLEQALRSLGERWGQGEPVRPPSDAAARIFELTPDELRGGLADGAVLPHFQPKVACATRTVVGVEALARWNHFERGLISPTDFIGVAERCGMIKELTRTMVQASLAQAGRWRRAGLNLSVAVNVSILDVEDLRFFDFMQETAAVEGVPPHMITLEVTESRIVDRLTSALETLTRLRLRGFRLSLDDYGTGASTLDHLRRLPIDELKIDRVFVHGSSVDANLRAMLESTVALAKQLDLGTVVEGVESEADWHLARTLGVDVIQGFAVARPMGAQDFGCWLPQWR